tara:strand:+ start:115 stop:300 length:186 start_codon:yes stop_codon:yes gene_type:complete
MFDQFKLLLELKPKDKVMITTDILGVFWVEWKEIKGNINLNNIDQLVVDINEHRACIDLTT